MSEIVVRDQREPGWFHVDNEIVDQYGTRLGAYGLSVYAVLCRRCTNSTQQVRNLSQRDIGAILDISQDRVRKSLNDLVEFGLISVEIPDRPSPGVISTITLLKVKTTERVAFSSRHELNVWRSPYKEVKTKTGNSPLLETGFFHSKEKSVSQPDFDARDRRLLAVERRKLEMDLNNGWGSNLTNEEIFEFQCARAGISVARALELEEDGKKWPGSQTEASA